jgi:hypothetical protein
VPPRDPDVPRLPRGKGISLTGPQMFKIVFFAALLVAVIVLQRPCSEAAGRFVGQFDTRDAAAPAPKPDPHPYPPGNYVDTSHMTPEQIKALFETRTDAGTPSAPK